MNPPAQPDRAVAIGIDIGATTTRVGLVALNALVLEHSQSPRHGFDKLTGLRDAPEPQAERVPIPSGACAVPRRPTPMRCASSHVLARTTIATPDSEEPMRRWLTTAIDELRAAHEANPVMTIGLAVPGVVEADEKRITRCVGLPYLEGTWLAKSMATHTRRPVVLTTDIDAATWSERLALASAPARFAHLRLGTGVGLGVIVEGKPQSIDPDRTTHASVLVVDEQPNAARCACGLRGCLEIIAGGRAIAKTARSLGFDGLPALQWAYDRKEPAARAVVEAAAKAITRAVVNIHRRYRPETLVLGGGVIEHLPALFERTTELLPEAAVSDTATSIRTLRVDRAQLGDDAGIIGAATLASVHPDRQHGYNQRRSQERSRGSMSTGE